jgi:hypothetical protein
MRQPQTFFWRKTMTAKEHNKLLSIFFFVQGGLQLFGGLLVVLIYGVFGIAALSSARREEEQIMGGVFLGLAVVVGAIILLLAAIDFMAGWKMLKEKPGARTWGIIASIISLPGVPLATALGIYGLWFLFGDQGKQFYAAGAGRESFNQPPPPNQWR